MPRQTNIQIRRGSASDWSSVNPTLASGELAMENDTRKIKVGDGSTAWNSLQYVRLDGGSLDEGAAPTTTTAAPGATTTTTAAPTTTTVAPTTTTTAAPTTTTAAPATSGSLWAWGGNYYGQLGGGMFGQDSPDPIQIGSDTNWNYMVVGVDQTYIIKTDGTLWRLKPELTQIGSDSDWAKVALDNDFNNSGPILALKTNGTLWNQTGASSFSQIGSDTWKYISCGGDHSVAIKSDDTLWAWGENYYGQIGDGSNISKASPVQIGSSTWKYISAGPFYTMAIKSDDTLWAWGSNQYGNLGNGTTTHSNSPIQIGSSTWNMVSTGGRSGYGPTTMAVKSDGTLWGWGRNWGGAIGDGTSTQRTSPVQVGSASNWRHVSVGFGNSHGIKNDDTLWRWGGATSTPAQFGSATWITVGTGREHAAAIKKV